MSDPQALGPAEEVAKGEMSVTIVSDADKMKMRIALEGGLVLDLVLLEEAANDVRHAVITACEEIRRYKERGPLQ